MSDPCVEIVTDISCINRQLYVTRKFLQVNTDFTISIFDDACSSSVGGGGSVFYQFVQAAGTNEPQRLKLDFENTTTINFAITDDSVNNRTKVAPAVITQQSITSDASGIKLSGDAASPGTKMYYGTDGSGVKGYYPLP